jgi:hypothetical protein
MAISLCIIHKEELCLSSGDINRLMKMMIAKKKAPKKYWAKEFISYVLFELRHWSITIYYLMWDIIKPR